MCFKQRLFRLWMSYRSPLSDLAAFLVSDEDFLDVVSRLPIPVCALVPMNTDSASLQSLTCLLAEFYSSSVKQDRREAIQNVLLNFEQNANAYYVALCYLCSTSDECVAIYCLGLIERTVARRWPFLATEHQNELRRVTRCYLFECPTNHYSSCLTRKAAKILSCIACWDWPTRYPEFLDEIKACILNSLEICDLSKTKVGLYLLQTAIEQLSDPPDAIDSSRKSELRTLLSREQGGILDLLKMSACAWTYQAVDQTLLRWNVAVLLSPDFGFSTYTGSVVRLAGCFAADLLKGLDLKCSLSLTWLECLGEVLKNLPVDLKLPPELCTVLYISSLLGSPFFLASLTSNLPTHSSNVPGLISGLSNIGLSALNCFHEIAERNDLRRQFRAEHLHFVLCVIQSHLAIISGKVPPQLSDRQNIEVLDTVVPGIISDYKKKLLNILHSSMLSFFCCLTDSSLPDQFRDFEPLRLIELLLDFTFFTTDLDFYISCLNLWSSYFDFVNTQYRNSVQFSPSPLSKSPPTNMTQPLLTFGKRLLSHLFYPDSAKFLDTLEDGRWDENDYCSDRRTEESLMAVILDEDSGLTGEHEPSEYQTFLRESLLLLYRAVEMNPTFLLNAIIERYREGFTDFHGMTELPDLLCSGRISSAPSAYHWKLRNYATSVQVVGFVMEHLKNTHGCTNNIPVSITEVELSRSLVYGLQTSCRLIPILPLNKDPMMKCEITEVIIQNVQTLHSAIDAKYLSCISGRTDEDKYRKLSFVSEVFRIVEQLVLVCDQSSMSFRIPLCGTQLLHSLFRSPDLNTVISLSLLPSNDNPNSEAASIRTIFFHLFDLIFDAQRLTRFRHDVRCELVRSFFYYLSFETKAEMLPSDQASQASEVQVSVESAKHDLLDRCVTQGFSPYLSSGYINEGQKVHLCYLGLLTEAIQVLESSTSVARHVVHASVCKAGILDNLMNCVSLALDFYSVGGALSPMGLKFCAAYLTFFTIFIQVLSQSHSSMSVIPNLLGRIIRTLSLVSNGCIPVPVLERLIDMFSLLSKNRKIFISVMNELVNLCITRLLPGLTTITDSHKDYDQDFLEKLVCNAAFHHGEAFQHLCDLLFTIIMDGFSYFFVPRTIASQDGTIQKADLFISVSERYHLERPEAFHSFMAILVCVAHKEQVNPEVVRFVLDKFGSLHHIRKLYDIPEFNKNWLPILAHRLMDNIVYKRHGSCSDVMLACLHQLVLSGPIGDQTIAASHNHNLGKGTYFLSCFLPDYLNEANWLTGDQRSSLLSSFFLLDLASFPQSNCRNVAIDVSDLSIFAQAVENFAKDFRSFQIQNECNLNAVSTTSVCSTPFAN
ncbi:unnamed protein product [Calicophoron daubneyi]|uniref:Exportin-1/Importin-beta-like domain-containing protein n=1 Tax=Calicophoron daubneyi TaxID=300641 RepID=A0AAV2TVJ2_CALDB